MEKPRPCYNICMSAMPTKPPDPFAVERIQGLAEQQKLSGLKSIKPMKTVLYLSLALLIAAIVLSAVEVMGGFGDGQAGAEEKALRSKEI